MESTKFARIVLCDTSKSVCDGWRSMLRPCSYRCGAISVSVYNGTLGTLLKRDCGTVAVVSPGNSFGFLGGGFDAALCRELGGEQFERWFRSQLGDRYHPVGSATVVAVSDSGFDRRGVRYVVHVPTMVAPCRSVYDRSKPVATGYSRAFDCMWNALLWCPEVDTLVVPGLATGYGGVPAEVACKSMVFALRVFAVRDRELQNILIMRFLGEWYRGFFGERWARECERYGIDVKALERFDASRDSIDEILPWVSM
ncbi:hypothetical protein HG537_0A04000 [Torulaspora globosa]|uniref:Macro domain-containing protein n=1 Tax=Torulaspora globosa TaxID=48254 RepID=A0A7H9HLI8_9SACH|nr:hypothetical protein HG537_0A04000 [Torulaspora sp. CBS 2947]